MYYIDVQDKTTRHTVAIIDLENKPVEITYRLPHEPIDEKWEYYNSLIKTDALAAIAELEKTYYLNHVYIPFVPKSSFATEEEEEDYEDYDEWGFYR